MNTKPKIGLAFGSGATRGFAHIGVNSYRPRLAALKIKDKLEALVQ